MAALVAVAALLLSAWTSWLAFRNRSDAFVTKLYEYQLAEATSLWESIAHTMSAVESLAQASLDGATEPRIAELLDAAKECLRETRRRSLKFALCFSPETMSALHQWNLELEKSLAFMSRTPKDPNERRTLSRPLLDSQTRLIVEFQRYLHVPELQSQLRKTIAFSEKELQEQYAQAARALATPGPAA